MNLYEQVKLPHKWKTPVILDIGANAGLEGKKMFDVFGPDAKVVFVEPLLINIAVLMQNIYRWGIQDRSYLEHTAVFHSYGWEVFDVTQNMSNTLNGHVGYRYESAMKLDVRSKLISDVARDANIVKVDIEGKEWVILPELVRNPNVQVIFVEAHFNPPGYDANMQDYLVELLAGTQFEATGWYACAQTHSEANDAYMPIAPVQHIRHGEEPPPYLVLERRESLL